MRASYQFGILNRTAVLSYIKKKQAHSHFQSDFDFIKLNHRILNGSLLEF